MVVRYSSRIGLIAAGAALALLSGCVVAPPGSYPVAYPATVDGTVAYPYSYYQTPGYYNYNYGYGYYGYPAYSYPAYSYSYRGPSMYLGYSGGSGSSASPQHPSFRQPSGGSRPGSSSPGPAGRGGSRPEPAERR